jgi:two-component system sensor histidine kinase RegB
MPPPDLTPSVNEPGRAIGEAVALPDPSNSLRRLLALRWIAVVAEVALVFLTRSWLAVGVPLQPVLIVCGAQVLVNLVSIWRRRPGQPVAAERLLAHMLFDTGALTAIAYLAGGSINPLITLYLPWVAVGAAILPARMAAALAAISIGCYSFVSFEHSSVHIHDPERAFEAHLFGMWLIFVFSAVTISWFVVRMTAAIRSRDAELAAAREAALRNERVVALGNLAAGAAHELGTPLATMAVLAGELARDPQLPAPLRKDVELMQAQLAECKRIITQLAVRAGSSRAESAQPAALDDWIAQLIDRWRLQRPRVAPEVDLSGAHPGPRIAADATLEQALLNLFNNAADASPNSVEIHARWSEAELRLAVNDRGPGIAADIEPRLGRDPVTTRDDGHGFGVVLAYAAIERSGGRLAFAPRPGGGTTAQVTLPLAGMLAG